MGEPATLQADEQRAFTAHPDAFATYKEFTRQKEAEADRLLLLIDGYNPELYKRFLDPEAQVSITSLGAGDGETELLFLQQIVAQRGTTKNLSISCVDPSPQMQTAFLKRAQELGLADLVGDYIIGKVEDPQVLLPPADLVLISHALYYIKDWQIDYQSEEVQYSDKNTLTKFRNSIKDGGLGAIILQSTSGQMGDLRHVFRRDVGYEDREVYSEKLQIDLVNAGQFVVKDWAYDGMSIPLDVSSCFQNEMFNPTAKGRQLLEFIFRQDWDRIPPNIQQEIGVEIKRHVHNYSLIGPVRADSKAIQIFDTFFLFPSMREVDRAAFGYYVEHRGRDYMKSQGYGWNGAPMLDVEKFYLDGWIPSPYYPQS